MIGWMFYRIKSQIDNKMIYNHPIGGMGNFFFQIAALWTLAKDNDDELCLINLDEIMKILINSKTNPIPHAEDWRYIFNRFPNENINTDKIVNHPFEYVKPTYLKDHQYFGYFQSPF